MLPKVKKASFAALVLLAVALGSYTLGFNTGAANPRIAITDSRQILNADFSTFWESVNLLKQKYVDIKDIKDQDIVYGAIRGAASALNDPYTTFFNPSDSQKFEQDIQGSFGGIGAEIGEKDNQIVIISPLKGNPADTAGLKAGDQIFTIDGTPTTDMTIDDAIKKIRGDVGTTVKLLIMRSGWTDAKEFDIKRAIINVPTVDMEMKGSIAVITLHNFNANAATLFRDAALKALSENAKGIVLDLRNNPGGYLEVAQDIAGWFLNSGSVVVVERFQSGEEQMGRAAGNAALHDVPVVILVNEGSASASEILAGALRDDRGVKLIGEKTFGKGSVQEVEFLSDHSSLKVSIAEWLTPNKTKINKVGLSPDIEVKLSDNDTAKGLDPQLDKGLEVVQAEVSALPK